MSKTSTLIVSFYSLITFIYVFSCSAIAEAATKEYISCDKVQQMCKELHAIIKQDGYQPDLLIGLARGGLQPLCYLAGEEQFNVRNVTTIGLASYDGMQQKTLRMLFPLHAEDFAQFKSILIVDDLIDSGKSVAFVKKLLETELKGATIRTAVLFYKPQTSIMKPEYYVEETDQWIVFPWEA